MSNSLKKRFSVGLATAVLAVTLGSGVVSAEAGLNGIGGTNTEQVQKKQQATTNSQANTQQSQGSNADAVGDMFNGIGVDAESAKEANEYVAPLAKTANFIFSLILGLTFMAMFVITALDLLYIGVPPIRSLLYSGEQSSGGGGGFGGGGFGGGQQQSGSKKQFISDEAVAVLGSSGGSSSGGGGGFGGGGGGFGGGGFGGGGFGGGGAQQETSKKSVLISYFKKRVVFLVAFGVVAILLSSTLFTDIGISIGNWVFNRLIGINDSIPE